MFFSAWHWLRLEGEGINLLFFLENVDIYYPLYLELEIFVFSARLVQLKFMEIEWEYIFLLQDLPLHNSNIYGFFAFFLFAGASKEIGTALTRICLRHKAVETRFKTFTSTLMDALVMPLQVSSIGNFSLKLPLLLKMSNFLWNPLASNVISVQLIFNFSI